MSAVADLRRLPTLLRRIRRIESGSVPAAMTGPIGIDLALERIHLVQLRRDTDGTIALAASAGAGYPLSRDETFSEPHLLAPLLRTAVRSAAFTGRAATVALPGGTFRTVSLSYSVKPGQSESAVLLELMRDRLEGDLADYVIDYIPIRPQSRDSQRMALVAASPRERVVAYLETLRGAGLTVQALEIGPVSVRRMINALPEVTHESNVIVVNTGREMTYITALAGRRLLSDQEFAFGEIGLLGRLARSLDMTPEGARDLVMRTGMSPLPRTDQVSVALNESGVFNTLLEIIKPELLRLVAEIERAVLFTSSQTHGGKVSQIYLTGALARWRGVTTALNSIIGLPVTSLEQPLRSFQPDTDGTGGTPDMAVAIGLALRGMVDDV